MRFVGEENRKITNGTFRRLTVSDILNSRYDKMRLTILSKNPMNSNNPATENENIFLRFIPLRKFPSMKGGKKIGKCHSPKIIDAEKLFLSFWHSTQNAMESR